MRKFFGISIASLLAGALLPSAAPALADACETVTVRTFRVKVAVQDDVYRMGETSHTVLTVHRKATGQPVSDANAGVAVYNKRHSNTVGFGWGKTNDRGRVHIRIKVRRSYVRPGPVTLFAFVYLHQVDTYCASVMEYGSRRVPRAFHAKP